MVSKRFGIVFRPNTGIPVAISWAPWGSIVQPTTGFQRPYTVRGKNAVYYWRRLRRVIAAPPYTPPFWTVPWDGSYTHTSLFRFWWIWSRLGSRKKSLQNPIKIGPWGPFGMPCASGRAKTSKMQRYNSTPNFVFFIRANQSHQSLGLGYRFPFLISVLGLIVSKACEKQDIEARFIDKS